MSRSPNRGRVWHTFAPAVLIGALSLGTPLPLHAQYVGKVDTSKAAKTPPLRSIGVLEYTGDDYMKPTASRLVPIAVWDGERYQPGGLYLAQPMPLAVDPGTQYELQIAGLPKGFFDVKAAGNANGEWIAIGAYQKPVVPKPSHLKASKNPPQLIHDGGIDDDRPHFAHRPADSGSSSGSNGSSSGSKSGGTSGSGNTSSNAPAVDPDRPTLHRRTDSGSDSGTTPDTSGGTSGSSGNSPGSGTSSGSTSSVDPDRPQLHRHTEANPKDNGAPVSATTEIDPDRPRLMRGRPAEIEALDAPSDVEVAKLEKNVENLNLMAAVSDTRNREPHSFVYSWTDPEDAKKAQAALETIAQNLLAGNKLQPAIAGKPSAAPVKKATATGTRTTHRATAKSAAPVLPVLANEDFKAYELSFGSVATLVFSAEMTDAQNKKHYVTIVAQPDFNGTPQVIFKQVTSDNELDVTPRMQIVDAVDTDADNRAELIFELSNQNDRQYAIYRVGDRSMEQVFSTAGS
jgi:hypothetical protein